MSIQRLSLEAPPSPLSSRAKPRDLRFSEPLLEMFFFDGVERPLREFYCWVKPKGNATQFRVAFPA
jgi:hypothetical protein